MTAGEIEVRQLLKELEIAEDKCDRAELRARIADILYFRSERDIELKHSAESSPVLQS